MDDFGFKTVLAPKAYDREHASEHAEQRTIALERLRVNLNSISEALQGLKSESAKKVKKSILEAQEAIEDSQISASACDQISKGKFTPSFERLRRTIFVIDHATDSPRLDKEKEPIVKENEKVVSGAIDAILEETGKVRKGINDRAAETDAILKSFGKILGNESTSFDSPFQRRVDLEEPLAKARLLKADVIKKDCVDSAASVALERLCAEIRNEFRSKDPMRWENIRNLLTNFEKNPESYIDQSAKAADKKTPFTSTKRSSARSSRLIGNASAAWVNQTIDYVKAYGYTEKLLSERSDLRAIINNAKASPARIMSLENSLTLFKEISVVWIAENQHIKGLPTVTDIEHIESIKRAKSLGRMMLHAYAFSLPNETHDKIKSSYHEYGGFYESFIVTCEPGKPNKTRFLGNDDAWETLHTILFEYSKTQTGEERKKTLLPPARIATSKKDTAGSPPIPPY